MNSQQADEGARDEMQDEVQDEVQVEVADGVGRITLNRPGAANALNLACAGRLAAAVDRLAEAASVGSVLVSGAGGRFCAGGDMAWLAARADRAAGGRELADTLDAAFRQLADLPKPVVVAVHGVVAGAGLALMLSCDVVIAEDSTRFTPSYPSVGLTPDCGLSWLLPRAVGSVRALDLLLTNRVIGAEEALAIGLVSRVVPDGGALGAAVAVATALAAGSPEASGHTRRLVRGAWESGRAAHGRLESDTIAQVAGTPYAVAAIDRFRR